jgi:hypothetical protein
MAHVGVESDILSFLLPPNHHICSGIVSVYTDIPGQGGRSRRRPRLMKHASWTRAMSSSVVTDRLWKKSSRTPNGFATHHCGGVLSLQIRLRMYLNIWCDEACLRTWSLLENIVCHNCSYITENNVYYASCVMNCCDERQRCKRDDNSRCGHIVQLRWLC